MTGDMKEGVAVDVYVEEKKVKTVIPVEGETTPLGEAIYKITFEDDSEVVMSSRKFQAVQSLEQSDATTARNELAKEIGKQIYGLMVEYGLKFSEIDPVLNETVRLANDGQNTANDILWGNEAYDRSLLDVNRVLLTKYGKEETETSAGDDGAAPEGSSVDSADKE